MLILVVYIPHTATEREALNPYEGKLQTVYPNTSFIDAEDFTYVNLKSVQLEFHQEFYFPAFGTNTLDLCQFWGENLI